MRDKRQVTFEKEELIKGVEIITKAVGSTLGPQGMTVLYEKVAGFPFATKDGVTVARQINLQDPIKNMGAQAIKQVAEKVVDLAGDGTTTATILAGELIRASHNYKDFNPTDFRRLAAEFVPKVVNYIKQFSTVIKPDDLETIHKVAMISSNGDEEIANIIRAAFQRVGIDGTVDVLFSHNEKMKGEYTPGFNIDRGYMSNEFVNQLGSSEVFYEDPLVLIYREEITLAAQLESLLNVATKQNRAIVVVADDFSKNILDNMIRHAKTGLKMVAVKTPGFGDRKQQICEDMTVLLGGRIVNKDNKEVAAEQPGIYFGSCKSVIVGRNTTIFIGGNGDQLEVENQRKNVQAFLEAAETEFERAEQQKRLSMLKEGVAIIRVGGKTEIEAEERKDRVEDALGATKAAVKEGFIPGGGTVLVRIAHELYRENSHPIWRIFCRAICEPFIKLHQNAGNQIQFDAETQNSLPIIPDPWDPSKDYDINVGYDINMKVTNLIEKGIIDPAMVTRICIENAFSVATNIATTKAIINLIPKEVSKSQFIHGDI